MTHLPARPLTSYPSSKLRRASIECPGDKSISHRALLLSALCIQPSHIRGLLQSDDIKATARAIQQLGATVITDDDQTIVHGAGNGTLLEPAEAFDFGNAGTGVRLTMGLLGSYNFSSTFTGDASLCARPMGRVLAPLQEMGTQILMQNEGRLPISLRGTPYMAPITYRVPVASAQVKSAVLLAALNCPGTTTVIEPHATRDHTERMLAGYGVVLSSEINDGGETVISIDGEQDLTAQNITVPGDPSSAAFPLVAGLICPDSAIIVNEVLLNPSRIGLIETLKEMGANIAINNERMVAGEPVGDISVQASELRGVTVPSDRAPSMIDEYPILSIAAAFAKGETRMEGIGELRVKESDRLAAVCAGLQANNINHEAGEDWLAVHGSRHVKGGGHVETHMDHRIAMSFLVLGLAAANPVTVDDGTMIATSFPNFISLMREMGAEIK